MSSGKWTGPAVHPRALQENGYLTLKGLAEYSSCSRAWLRAALVDPVHPLPHFKLPNKVLVRKAEFDAWLLRYRRDDDRRPQRVLDDIVDDVMAGLRA